MSVYVGESRGELLSWINGLLDMELKKVEQCGTGAVYCQIMDSIYGNLPMTRVKYNARQEYEYLENFKVLQQCFKRNGIDKPIPVEKLIKCKMQDNLEFLQWMKKFWDSNGSGMVYDAAARSGGQTVAPIPSSSRAPAPARTAARVTPTSGPAAGRAASGASAIQMQHLHAQVEEMQEAYLTIEKEKAFYFEKLRNVEIIVNARSNVEGITAEEKDVLAKITEILYATEEGFDLPQNGGEEGLEQGAGDDETY